MLINLMFHNINKARCQKLSNPCARRGPKEPLDSAELFTDLFQRLCDQRQPWAAALCMLQLICGGKLSHLSGVGQSSKRKETCVCVLESICTELYN